MHAEHKSVGGEDPETKALTHVFCRFSYTVESRLTRLIGSIISCPFIGADTFNINKGRGYLQLQYSIK